MKLVASHIKLEAKALDNKLHVREALNGTFCLFEYRALFCVIWSFFVKKWPKSDVMIHRTLHLLDI